MKYGTELTVVVLMALFLGTQAAYLAFPRQGRSGHAPSSTSCCPTGLKLEWALGKQGLDFSYQTCARDLPCCEGLEEIVRSKPNGMFYSICVPTRTGSFDYFRE